jgi:hypothetical protein
MIKFCNSALYDSYVDEIMAPGVNITKSFRQKFMDKPNLVKFKFVIMTICRYMTLKYLEIQKF